MKWEVVKLSGTSRGRGTPSVSVGFGRMAFNSAACSLIKNQEEYWYAQVLKGKDESGRKCIGVKLLKSREAYVYKISRRKYNGGYVKTIEISNKELVDKLFSIAGTQNKSTTYPVTKDPDDDTTLIILGA